MYKTLLKYEIPKMSATEDLGFSNLPECLTTLSDVEERMVAPYIPFMQIKALLPFAMNPQLSLAGGNMEKKSDEVKLIIESEKKEDTKQNFPVNMSTTENMETDECIDEYPSEDNNNAEILLIDRNKQLADDLVIIAPGQDKKPMPWHRIEDFDELCSPRIFGGNQFDKI
ncbi:hypothetical protein QAD02_013335 [Eretmocerus hayati]|uniref:Uncharacterized protein n=1 Tax=Eretmocerus hayati TaxID=131215 RepID=A0ACC2P366_9HYME|nr:hypothetical protein QAD02_013335 [Eretmocerus hayati]